jgi:hypothetical protein
MLQSPSLMSVGGAMPPRHRLVSLRRKLRYATAISAVIYLRRLILPDIHRSIGERLYKEA